MLDFVALEPAMGTLASGQSADVVERTMSSGLSLPFDVRSTIGHHTGLQHVLLLLSIPIDDVTSYFTFVVLRTDDFSVSAEEIIRFDLAIGIQYKVMLEKLDGVLPLDQTALVSVQADKCSVEWRRRLAAALFATLADPCLTHRRWYGVTMFAVVESDELIDRRRVSSRCGLEGACPGSSGVR